MSSARDANDHAKLDKINFTELANRNISDIANVRAKLTILLPLK